MSRITGCSTVVTTPWGWAATVGVKFSTDRAEEMDTGQSSRNSTVAQST